MKRDLQPVDFIMKDHHSGFRTLKIGTWMRHDATRCDQHTVLASVSPNGILPQPGKRMPFGSRHGANIHESHDLKTGPLHVAELHMDQ